MQENNRECLKIFFQKVNFLVGQGLACRGKIDEESNFREAFNFIIESHNKEHDLNQNNEYANDLVKN